MVKENTYINIQAFMVNDLHLKGNELIIYAIIWGFSQDGISEFKGGLQYLADWTNSTQQGVLKALKSLLQKQLILKNEKRNGFIKYCTYKTTETKFNGNEPLNKVESPTKQSLIDDETKFNGAIKQSLSNNISDNISNNINDNIKPKQKKEKLGTFLNVLLTNAELQKLINKLGQEKTSAVIRNFSELKEMKGYKYKSDYLAILRWGIEAYEKKNGTSQNGGYVNNKRPASDSIGCDVDF